MGNRVMCGGAPQSCVDECARLHFETRSRDADEPECDPAGAVFQETLVGLPPRDQEGLLFAGTANLVALRWLLLLGANPKARDRNGTTLLHAACRSGSFLVAQELLRRELPLDSIDSAGWTPLHVAAMMGRRELTQLLLQAQINPHVQNKRGASPLDLCSDAPTREALRTFALKLPEVVSSRMNSVEEYQRLARVQGEVGEDPTATCEPFFVPRQPIFEDEAHYKVLVNIGLEMAHKSAAHALAFFVATGVVHDHPTDLSAFLIENKVDPCQLGEFMGEDFSLAQTLRLAFVHTMDLAGTGVVGALRKVFSYMRPPMELSKIDRITAAAAHLWWRTHDLDDAPPYLGGMQEADDALEWTLFSEADTGGGAAQDGRQNSTWFPGNEGEVCGARLRSVLHSVEGLARLQFSTVLLCWNIRRVLPDTEGDSNARLSFQEWLEVNSRIEADGTTPSVAVQKCIYNTLLQDECPELLPDAQTKRMEMPKFREAPEQTSSLRAAGQVVGESMNGWASIPPGGLERYDVPLQIGHPGSGLSGAKLSHCVLSETSSSFLDRGHKNGISLLQPELTASSGEAVWMSLKYAFWLFLSVSPDDPAPYAFIRLQDTVLRETNASEKSLVLAGRMKPSNDEDAAGPFGDTARQPLKLCFLLADGRFQLLEALWLELQLQSEEEMQQWARAISNACFME